MTFTLKPGTLTISDIRTLLNDEISLEIPPYCNADINAAVDVIKHVIDSKQTVYGINTGFGLLASTRIDNQDLENLQKRIVLSHAAGTGELLSDRIVRLIMILKINSLARGYSGVRLETINALLAFLNHQLYPCIPAKGSVGASGDLAPLAHLSAALLGVGNVRHKGKVITALEALKIAGLNPLTLAAKEGLALLNGTQTSTALAIIALLDAENIFISALATGAMSVDAACGSIVPFDERISAIRGHATQSTVAAIIRDLLKDSKILASHKGCEKVQDPYSLRCQPQVMGACLSHLNYICDTLVTEANGVSDNPLIFASEDEILSGGNFHAEPVAMAADALAVCVAEIGSLSERRTALLVDPHFNGGLPAFLVNNPGVNSGFMLAHVTSTALVSENKSLAHPASVDSIPSSANQEDHVSMATYAGNRLQQMTLNTATVVAIELLSACQGIDLRRPLTSSPDLESIHQLVRDKVTFYDEDRFFAPDIEAGLQLILSGAVRKQTGLTLLS